MIHVFTKKIKEYIYSIHYTFTAIIFVCIFLGQGENKKTFFSSSIVLSAPDDDTIFDIYSKEF